MPQAAALLAENVGLAQSRLLLGALEEILLPTELAEVEARVEAQAAADRARAEEAEAKRVEKLEGLLPRRYCTAARQDEYQTTPFPPSHSAAPIPPSSAKHRDRGRAMPLAVVDRQLGCGNCCP